MTDQTEPVEQPEPEAPDGETKAQAFKRLGQYRLKALVKRMRSIGHLANRSAYEYTPEQVDAIERLITAETAAMLNKFRGRDKDEPVITL